MQSLEPEDTVNTPRISALNRTDRRNTKLDHRVDIFLSVTYYALVLNQKKENKV